MPAPGTWGGDVSAVTWRYLFVVGEYNNQILDSKLIPPSLFTVNGAFLNYNEGGTIFKAKLHKVTDSSVYLDEKQNFSNIKIYGIR